MPRRRTLGDLFGFAGSDEFEDWWTPLKLKLEETSYFASQLQSYERHPRLFLFHLSAFLAAARSVTWHIQAQFSTEKKEYERLRAEMLADDVAGYFVELRNTAQKQGYPPVTVEQHWLHRAENGQMSWTAMAAVALFGPGDRSAWSTWLEDLLATDLEVWQPDGPIAVRYVWMFNDFPGDKRRAIGPACAEFADRLWEFVFRFRDAWEKAQWRAEREKKEQEKKPPEAT
jgi:hypothetical protein